MPIFLSQSWGFFWSNRVSKSNSSSPGSTIYAEKEIERL